MYIRNKERTMIKGFLLGQKLGSIPPQKGGMSRTEELA